MNVTVGRAGDTAASGTDYTPVAGFAVTIAAGQTTGTASFTLRPTDDQVAEGPEEITVHGTASGLSVDDATLTLNDDDAASTSVSLSLDPGSVSEDAGSVSVEVTAELNGAASSQPTTVNVTVGHNGDSAESGTDYTPVAGFAVTIAAGQTTGTATFTLAPNDDQVAEGPEEITVRGTASGFTVDDATLTLNDDDAASTSVSLSLDPGSVSEDAGSVSLKVTATLDQQASPEPTAVTLTVGRTGDAAESGTDYTTVADYVRVVLTIPGGETTGTATFTLTPVDDELAEGPETITVHGTASGLSVDDATLTLNDDDTASTSVSLSLDTASVSEDDTAQQIEVTAELNQQAGTEPIAVNVTVGRTGDSAIAGTDYTPVAGFAVTIAAGQTTGTATFTLRPTDDQVAEGLEEITVHGTASGLSVEDATLTLNDDDAASTSVSLSLDTASVSEDDTAQQIEVTAELNQQAGTEPIAVNVTVGRAGDTAASGTDYTPVAGFAVTIAAGQTTGTASFTLRPTDDQVAEGPEEITVHGTASGLSVDDATLTLNDDDAASTSVSLSLDPGSVSEDAGSVSLKVTATLDQQASPEPTAVTLTVGRTGDAAESGTDYTTVADYIRVVLTIPGGETTGTATFTLTPVDTSSRRVRKPSPCTGPPAASPWRTRRPGRRDARNRLRSPSVSPFRWIRLRGGSGGDHRARDRQRPLRGGRDAHPERRRHRVHLGVPFPGYGFRVRGRHCPADRGDGRTEPAGRHGADRGERHRGARRRHRRFRDGLHARRRLRRHDRGGTDDRDGELHSAADG